MRYTVQDGQIVVGLITDEANFTIAMDWRDAMALALEVDQAAAGQAAEEARTRQEGGLIVRPDVTDGWPGMAAALLDDARPPAERRS